MNWIKKNCCLILVIFITVGIIFLFMVDKSPQDLQNDYSKQIDSLSEANTTLLDSIAARDIRTNFLKRRIDSLSNTEKDVKIEYSNKYEKIKDLPASALSVEFDSIFSDNNIR